MGWVAIIVILLLLTFVGAMMGFAASSRAGKLERSLEGLKKQVNDLRQEILELKLQGIGKDPGIAKPKIAKPKIAKPKAVKPKAKPEAQTGTEAEPVKPRAEKPPVTTAKPVPAMAAAAAAPALQADRDGPKTKPQKPARNFEFELGAKWTVWVGGLALLLGAVFLLRYSIESGFFTPAMRVAMAGFLGVALLGCGEWLRRGENLPKAGDGKPIEIFENNYIPGILTAVGIFTLLATIFAAHELYGFIGAGPASLLMGAVSMGGLALGLVHGPYISALGLAAAFATPILIKSEDPSFMGLFAYLAIISAAAWALARLRDWSWLAMASFIGAIFWLAWTIYHVSAGQNFIVWTGFFALVLLANLYFAKDRSFLSKNLGLTALNHNGMTAAIFSAVMGLVLLVLSTDFKPISLQSMITAIGFAALLCASPFYKRIHAPNFWIAGAFAYLFQTGTQHGSLTTALILAGILAGSGFLFYLRRRAEESKADEPKSNRLENSGVLAVALVPPVILATSLEAYPAPSEVLVGSIMIAFSALLAAAAVYMYRAGKGRLVASSYIAASALAYVLAALIELERPGLNAAFAAGIAVYALLHRLLPKRTTRWLALVMAGLTLGFTLIVTLDSSSAVSARPFVNELWIYFALPAALSFFAGRELGKDRPDIISEGLKGAAIIFAALFIVYQIRHYMTDGALYSRGFTFDELGLYVATGLAFTLGRRQMNIPLFKPGQKSEVFQQFIPAIFSALTWLTLGIFLIVLCLILAPLINPETAVKGGLFANSLILGYLIPIALMGLIIWTLRKEPTDLQSGAMRGLTLVGLMIYVTSQIRVFFSGMKISIFEDFPEGLETYVITASWMVIAVLALAIGVKYNRKSFRLGSGIILILTVLKAFLVDMATLEGVLRAISFVILGVVLIIIGRVYQKLLFAQKS